MSLCRRGRAQDLNLRPETLEAMWLRNRWHRLGVGGVGILGLVPGLGVRVSGFQGLFWVPARPPKTAGLFKAN